MDGHNHGEVGRHVQHAGSQDGRAALGPAGNRRASHPGQQQEGEARRDHPGADQGPWCTGVGGGVHEDEESAEADACHQALGDQRRGDRAHTGPFCCAP